MKKITILMSLFLVALTSCSNPRPTLSDDDDRRDDRHDDRRDRDDDDRDDDDDDHHWWGQKLHGSQLRDHVLR